ncbi:MAG: hypothetical protein ACRECZ_04075 [Methylocella sp.]
MHIVLQPHGTESLTSDPLHLQFQALLASLNVMVSTAPRRLRLALLVFGAVLGLSGLWMLLPELLRPTPSGLAFDRNGIEAAAARRTSAVLAAEIGAIRGDLWAEAAFTGARFMWTDRSTIFDWSNSGQLARVRANAETAVALAPVNGAAWLFLAKLPASSPEGENRVGTLLEMSYFTAPSALDLAPWRLERAATSNALTDKDLQVFIKSDIRGILDRGPENRQAIMTAYRKAWPQNQPIFKSLVADADPAVAQLLRSGQPK